MFNLVASYRNYGPFSNKQWQGNPGRYGSIEDVHDTIHVETGGQGTRNRDSPGHMGLVPYAAFDPVFWLHHTYVVVFVPPSFTDLNSNVDRFFAIWQALNPNSYVTPQDATEETLTTEVGTEENKTSALTPFWETRDAFWTSDGVRKTGTLGYAYPETQSWKFSTPQQYRSNVSAVFRQLYGGSNLGSILADSSPGNLSDRARLNIPVRASVKLASKVPAKSAESVPAQASVKATSSQPSISAVSVEQIKAGVQKPLAETKPNAEPKHEEPKQPAHGNPQGDLKHDDIPKRKSV